MTREVRCEIIEREREREREMEGRENTTVREKKGFLKVRRFCDSNDEKTACVVGFIKKYFGFYRTLTTTVHSKNLFKVVEFV